MIGKVRTIDINKHICTVQIDNGTFLDNVFAPPLNGSVYPQVNDLVEIENYKRLWRVKAVLLKNAPVNKGIFNLYASEVNINQNGQKAFISYGAGWHD